jgi:hypothetical protein
VRRSRVTVIAGRSYTPRATGYFAQGVWRPSRHFTQSIRRSHPQTVHFKGLASLLVRLGTSQS